MNLLKINMIYNRDQFIDWIIREVKSNLDIFSKASPLWVPEHDLVSECRWFVLTKPIPFNARFDPDGRGNQKKTYYEWCDNNLQGQTRCFLSNAELSLEWWGFTHKQDAMWWMLKWHR